MRVQLITAAYDSGYRNVRMGRGPAHLIELGAAQVLQDRGDDVVHVDIEIGKTFAGEVGVAFDLNRRIAACVAALASEQRLPIVLAGNCNATVGAVAALESPAVIWFDAHADFNTPDTFVSGFLDGMALAMLTGRCWTALTHTVPGFTPIAESHVVLVGTRDIDDMEADLLRASDVAVLTASTVQRLSILDALAPVLRTLHARTERVYLHIDLDVLDPSEGEANTYAAPNGLSLEHLLAAIRRIGEQFTIVGATLSAYDPTHDRDDRAGRAALRVLEAISAAHSPSGGDSKQPS